MKTLCFLLLLLITGSVSVFGQAPGEHHSVSMDVKVVGSGGGSKNAFGATESGGTAASGKSGTTSSSHTAVHQTALEINVRNISQQPDSVTVEGLSVGEPA